MKISKTLISILHSISFFIFAPYLDVCMRRYKVVAFQVRRRPLTQTAYQAEPVMDGKWTAVDRQEDGGGHELPDGDTPNSQVLFCQ